MIEQILIEHDICEADGQQVWFIYIEQALYKVAYSKTEVVKAITEILAKEIEE